MLRSLFWGRVWVVGIVAVGSVASSGCDDDEGSGTPPDTVIDEAPAALSNQTRVAITFHANGDANAFACQLDDQDPVECTSPFEADVGEGPHTFRVAAALNARIDLSPAEHAWTVDATVPETTILSGPPALDNSLTPEITFEGSDPGGGAVTFECALDGDPFAACTTPSVLVVVDGEHVYQVRAKDVAGNVDASPAEHRWTIDATAPETVITAGPTNNLTTGRAVAFSFMSPNTDPATFDCQLDGGAFAPCTSPHARSNLAGGSHTFVVRAKDASAMDPSPAMRTWTVDATPPDVTITSTPANPSNDTTPSFGFSSTDATATFECQIDAAAFVACTSIWDGPTVAAGSRTFRVRASDPFGNVSAPSAFTWLVDLTPPDTTIVTAEPALTNDPTGDFTFTANPAAGSTFECAIDGGAFTACTTPFSTAALADGPHTFAVRAVDAAGNADPSPDTHAWTVDATPPDTMIVTAEADPTSDTTGDFTFAASETATFQCSIDGGAFAACGASFTTPALGQGPHVLAVRAVDAAGNVDASPATHAWTVDSLPPDTTIATAEPSPTSDPTGEFTFTSTDATATFQCDLDNGGFVACPASFVTGALADGSHTLRVRAIDAAGNIDATPDAHTWIVDTAPPDTTIVAAEPDPTSDPTGDFTFSATQGGSTFECSVDGAAFTACTSPFSTAALASGAHTFAVRATDPAGNTDPTPATHTWTLDDTDPDTTITTFEPDPTNDPTGDFTFSSTEPGTFQCSVDGAAFTACSATFSTAALADGDHTLAVRAVDSLGNIDPTPATYSWTVDTTPPNTAFTSTEPDPTNDPTGDFTFTATPATGATFECAVDGAAFTACTTPFSTAALGDGPHTLQVRASDALGNTDPTPASFTWSVDTTAPDTTIGTAPSSPDNDPTPTFTFTASPAGGATFECSLDGAAFTACATPHTTVAIVGDGSHTFAVRALDALGNADPTPDTHTWTLDTSPPETTITTAPPDPDGDNTPTFAFSSEVGATFECRVLPAGFAACTSPFTTATLADGSHTFEVRATDAAGNVDPSPDTHTWTVSTAPPDTTIVSAPSNPDNDDTPQFTFAATPAAGATFECSLDGAAFTACTSPHTTAPIATDGSHTFRVRAVSQFGTPDPTPDAHTWVLDTVVPIVTISDRPPSTWPVNYYDMVFASPGATLECSLNGAAFAPCTSPRSIVTAYDIASTFTVRATDPAGNVGTSTATWTSSANLVLHYPWEQGVTDNTSLLVQRAGYSPDGNVAVTTDVGGWAGGALGHSIGAHTYANTRRVLTSSATDEYVASFWLRTSDAGSGTLISTVAAGGGGFRLSITGGSSLRLGVFSAGVEQFTTVIVGEDRWVSVAVRASSTGAQLFLDGVLAGSVTQTGGGFDATQAAALVVGATNQIDLDDLRFYNHSLTNAEMCTTVARGTVPSPGLCSALVPGAELDMENQNIVDTGNSSLVFNGPAFNSTDFVAGLLGDAWRIADTQDAFGYSNLKAYSGSIAGSRSFTFTFDSNAGFGTWLDTTQPCTGGECGIRVSTDDSGALNFFAGTNTVQAPKSVTPPLPRGYTTVVLVEHRNGAGNTTTIDCYVRGVLETTLDLQGSGDVFGQASDQIRLASIPGMVFDEFEFWPFDLAKDPMVLCENGFDGEWDHVAGTCTLTAN